MNYRDRVSFLCVTTLLMLVAGAASATRINMVMEWQEATFVGLDTSGDNVYSYGPGRMDGTFSFDDSLIVSFVGQPPIALHGAYRENTLIPLQGNPNIFNLEITIKNSSGFDGSWGLPDFETFVIHTWNPLDYTKELVGQDTGFAIAGRCLFAVHSHSDCWSSGQLGTFLFQPSLTSDFPGKTLHSAFYEMPPYRDANNQTLTWYHLTSARLVPVPFSAALVIAGIAIMLVVRRRQVSESSLLIG